MSDKSWEKIFSACKIMDHDFEKEPFFINASQIKKACQDFTSTTDKEVRILCKQDYRDKRPKIFRDKGIFILPVKNGQYIIIKGEGYVDIPPIIRSEKNHISRLNFTLDTSLIGNSEMQHLDFAYASSIIRTFMNDQNLVLTIRGRKYTPSFSFRVGKQNIDVESVQTEVDAGYESEKQVVLIEAKNSQTTNTIIRQLFYPFKQWQKYTKKPVVTLFFEKKDDIYSLWEFNFDDPSDYNSIKLVQSCKYTVVTNKQGTNSVK
jgi:hypothetical protein